MAGVSARYLADTSVLARMLDPRVAAHLRPLMAGGEVATCGMVELEVLYSTRGYNDLVRTRAFRSRAFSVVPMDQSDFDRASEVMEALAARGYHRSAALPDLLIAAVAERAGLTLIHYDEDFDRIASVTGQSARWVSPRGSL